MSGPSWGGSSDVGANLGAGVGSGVGSGVGGGVGGDVGGDVAPGIGADGCAGAAAACSASISSRNSLRIFSRNSLGDLAAGGSAGAGGGAAESGGWACGEVCDGICGSICCGACGGTCGANGPEAGALVAWRGGAAVNGEAVSRGGGAAGAGGAGGVAADAGVAGVVGGAGAAGVEGAMGSAGATGAECRPDSRRRAVSRLEVRRAGGLGTGAGGRPSATSLLLTAFMTTATKRGWRLPLSWRVCASEPAPLSARNLRTTSTAFRTSPWRASPRSTITRARSSSSRGRPRPSKLNSPDKTRLRAFHGDSITFCPAGHAESTNLPVLSGSFVSAATAYSCRRGLARDLPGIFGG